jgi:hypothetical protein
MFIKYEPCPLTKIASAPRAIQFRKQKYTFNLAKFIYQLDKTYFSKKGKASKFVFSLKGLNPEERARIFREKAAGIRNPRFAGLDAAKWDAHYFLIWLILEHLWDLMHFHDSTLENMLISQVVNVFYTGTGLQYVFIARRASGDFTTSSGNNTTHAAVQEELTHELEADYGVDGDDGLDIIGEPDYPKFLENLKKPLGFEIVLEEESDSLSGITFCQCRYVEDGDYCRMVRSPTRVITHLQNTIRTYDGNNLKHYYYQIACSLQAEFPGIEYYQPIIRSFQRAGIATKRVHHDFIRITKLHKGMRKIWPRATECITNVWGDLPILREFDIPAKSTPEHISQLVTLPLTS